jgi:hypothetical protein
MGVYQWGIRRLAVPMLKDCSNCYDALSIDIHETHISGTQFAEFRPICLARNEGTILFDPSLMGPLPRKIFGLGVEVVIVHSFARSGIRYGRSL